MNSPEPECLRRYSDRSRGFLRYSQQFPVRRLLYRQSHLQSLILCRDSRRRPIHSYRLLPGSAVHPRFCCQSVRLHCCHRGCPCFPIRLVQEYRRKYGPFGKCCPSAQMSHSAPQTRPCRQTPDDRPSEKCVPGQTRQVPRSELPMRSPQ